MCSGLIIENSLHRLHAVPPMAFGATAASGGPAELLVCVCGFVDYIGRKAELRRQAKRADEGEGTKKRDPSPAPALARLDVQLGAAPVTALEVVALLALRLQAEPLGDGSVASGPWPTSA